MTMIAPAPVRRNFTVATDPQRAFDVFVSIGRWWQASHSITTSGQANVVIEPRAGGRWYERGVAGELCQWGEVQVWEPPHRLVLIWGLDADWAYDPELRTEIEVRFTAEEACTRVEFEHRKLEAFGARAKDTAAQLGSDGGWTGLLAGYAAMVVR